MTRTLGLPVAIFLTRTRPLAKARRGSLSGVAVDTLPDLAAVAAATFFCSASILFALSRLTADVDFFFASAGHAVLNALMLSVPAVFAAALYCSAVAAKMRRALEQYARIVMQAMPGAASLILARPASKIAGVWPLHPIVKARIALLASEYWLSIAFTASIALVSSARRLARTCELFVRAAMVILL